MSKSSKKQKESKKKPSKKSLKKNGIRKAEIHDKKTKKKHSKKKAKKKKHSDLVDRKCDIAILYCTGCGKRCPLSSPKCSKGRKQAAAL